MWAWPIDTACGDVWKSRPTVALISHFPPCLFEFRSPWTHTHVHFQHHLHIVRCVVPSCLCIYIYIYIHIHLHIHIYIHIYGAVPRHYTVILIRTLTLCARAYVGLSGALIAMLMEISICPADYKAACTRRRAKAHDTVCLLRVFVRDNTYSPWL